MPECPECHSALFVVAGEPGYLCTLCLRHWPYDDEDLPEPDYDFGEFREWCETFGIKAEWVHFDFIKWLYSESNTRAHAPITEGS